MQIIPQQRRGNGEVLPGITELENLEAELSYLANQLRELPQILDSEALEIDVPVAEEGRRIDPFVVNPDFKMTMRASGLSSTTAFSDYLPSFHMLAGFDESLGVVPVIGDDAVPMVDDDQDAVSAIPAGVLDDAGTRSKNWRSERNSEINTTMEFRPVSIARTDVSVSRPGPLREFFRCRCGDPSFGAGSSS